MHAPLLWLWSLLLVQLDSDSPESENPESWLLFGEARVLKILRCLLILLIFSLALLLLVLVTTLLLLFSEYIKILAPGSHTWESLGWCWLWCDWCILDPLIITFCQYRIFWNTSYNLILYYSTSQINSAKNVSAIFSYNWWKSCIFLGIFEKLVKSSVSFW